MTMQPEPFAPPEDQRRSEGEGLSAMMVVIGWAVAGAAMGTAFGAWGRVFGLVPSAVPVGMGLALFGGVAGAVAYAFERRGAAGRRELVDARGKLVRPLSDWLFTMPTVAGGLGFASLVLMSILRSGTLAPAILLVLVVAGMVLVLRPVMGGAALRRGVELLEAGEIDAARQRLSRVYAQPWWSWKVRAMAALDLGLLALSEGELDEAEIWYERAGAARSGGLAAASLALVRVLQDRYPEAHELLAAAASTAEGRHAQAEIDGVRLLLVLRRDGHDDARVLGSRLQGPGNGGLFLSVLAAAKQRAGDGPGARELLAEPAVEETLQSGFGRVIPELVELRWLG